MNPVAYITETADCKRCGKPFDYVRVDRKRRVCPACVQDNLKQSLKRFRAAQPALPTKQRYAVNRGRKGFYRPHRKAGLPAYHVQADEVAKASIAEIAAAQGMSPTAVIATLDNALRLIRGDPELQELWAIYKTEGGGGAAAWSAGEQLLEWQLELTEWYAVYESIVSDETQAEAAECMAEIARFHRALGKLLAEGNHL
jgi:hypothetical protein